MQCCYLFVLRVKCKMLIFLNEVRYVCLFRGEDSPDKSRARSKHFKKEIETSDSDSDQRSRSKVRKEKIRSIVSKKAAAPDSDSDSSGDSWEQERPPSDRPGIVCLKKKKGRPGGGDCLAEQVLFELKKQSMKGECSMVLSYMLTITN